VELVDEAVQAVAALEEPEEMNFVRKHPSDLRCRRSMGASRQHPPRG
jgi:cobalamin biosynthesis Mg chelatase CobN